VSSGILYPATETFLLFVLFWFLTLDFWKMLAVVVPALLLIRMLETGPFIRNRDLMCVMLVEVGKPKNMPQTSALLLVRVSCAIQGRKQKGKWNMQERQNIRGTCIITIGS
jgi:hypothetical protein